MTHILAKAFGWLQFAVTLGNQVIAQPPHGLGGWLTTLASLAAAIGIHAASSTDGAK